MRILIIEDEEDLTTALSKGLRREGYAVDVANDGESGWELAEINNYDLLLLDLNLPGLDGLELCRRVKNSQPHLLILMLTARSQLIQRITGLDAGADDYLIKPFHFGELLARIRALLRRDMRTREPVLEFRALLLDRVVRTAWKNKQILELTNKEFGILEYLLCHRNEVVTQEDLLEHVWDVNANPFTTSVRVHINSLRHKLKDQQENPPYIETIVGKGYRLNSDENNGQKVIAG